MELKSELKIIQVILILTIASGTLGLGMWFSADILDAPKNVTSDTKVAVSGFGEIKLYEPDKVNLFSTNTYQDTSLRFQISKPNSDWEIHSTLDELSSEILAFLKSKGFLDGVYIEQNHDKRFMLTVFDVQKEDFSLQEYVDDQIYLMKSKNFVIPFEQVSPEDDWALFAVKSFNDKQYREHLLFMTENRLFMLQYSGVSPQLLDSEQKKDFKLIMDSFEVI